MLSKNLCVSGSPSFFRKKSNLTILIIITITIIIIITIMIRIINIRSPSIHIHINITINVSTITFITLSPSIVSWPWCCTQLGVFFFFRLKHLLFGLTEKFILELSVNSSIRDYTCKCISFSQLSPLFSFTRLS